MLQHLCLRWPLLLSLFKLFECWSQSSVVCKTLVSAFGDIREGTCLASWISVFESMGKKILCD